MTTKSPDDHPVDISLLHLNDAHEFAPLLASYAQALKRGAPRRPDDYYAENLLRDRAAEIAGARLDGHLVGFVIFYDLPEPVSGMRAGQVDHIYVHHDHRGKGIAKALIDVLAAAQKTHDTAMLYVSDHGESLGESGLYLHGVPYAIAPDVQLRVPFVLWLSKALQESGIDEACMRRRAQQPAGHDNLFHSLLGLYSVQTQAYDAGRDIFSGCRTKRSN